MSGSFSACMQQLSMLEKLADALAPTDNNNLEVISSQASEAAPAAALLATGATRKHVLQNQDVNSYATTAAAEPVKTSKKVLSQSQGKGRSPLRRYIRECSDVLFLSAVSHSCRRSKPRDDQTRLAITSTQLPPRNASAASTTPDIPTLASSAPLRPAVSSHHKEALTTTTAGNPPKVSNPTRESSPPPNLLSLPLTYSCQARARRYVHSPSKRHSIITRKPGHTHTPQHGSLCSLPPSLQ